jgi:Zn-dependent protease/CBS domain-containing protein
MKWSLRVGRILGTEVKIHLTFFVLLGVVGVSQWLAGHSLAAAAEGLLFVCGVFLCVLLHEYGHVLAARSFGIQTHDITLLPIGGVARLERMPEKPGQELVVALAGPLVNVVIASGLLAGLVISGHWQPLGSMSTTHGGLLERLVAVNGLLAVFNLLPAFPMDGGRVLRALLALRMDYVRATGIAAKIGQGMALILGGIGLFANPMLILIAGFVWFGAAQEAAAVRLRSRLSGYRVREAMQTEFRVVTPQTSLAEAAGHLVATAQRDFPVVEGGQVLGMLSQARLLEALGQRGADASVASVMRSPVEALDASDLLESVMAHSGGEMRSAWPVISEGRLVGLLTAENLGMFYLVRSAGDRRRSGRPPGKVSPPPLPVRPLPPRPGLGWGAS